VKAENLELSKVKKAELFDFMKGTTNKEEYRRASAIKQKLEGLSYRTIARNLDVNYRNVYNWIKEYIEYGLDGIRSKRNNAGRIPKIFSDKNKQLIKAYFWKYICKYAFYSYRARDLFSCILIISSKHNWLYTEGL
jgi:hypothetical protein